MLLRVFNGDGHGDDDLQEVMLPEALRTKLAGLRAWKAANGEGYGSLVNPRKSSSPWSRAASSSFAMRPNTRRMRRLSTERR